MEKRPMLYYNLAISVRLGLSFVTGLLPLPQSKRLVGLLGAIGNAASCAFYCRAFRPRKEPVDTEPSVVGGSTKCP